MNFPTDSEFPQLANPPIAEAVIDIRATLGTEWDESGTKERGTEKLPKGYEYVDSPRQYSHSFKVNDKASHESVFRDLGPQGVRFQSEDRKQVIQFNRNGYAFSRLEPYTCWKKFSQEGLKNWHIYKSVFPIETIDRLGLRYINKIEIPADTNRWDEYMKILPQKPGGLDIGQQSFLYRDIYLVPDTQFQVNVIRTNQISNETRLVFILDIDVMTQNDTTIKEEDIAGILEEMRLLKNKTFYGIMKSEKIKELCK
ncbi:MAG: TIGR04255 family protein [Candidatus Sumerlaeia bacterium]